LASARNKYLDTNSVITTLFLARSTRDLLNTPASIVDRGAGFRSLADAWADTTPPHGRLMVTILGGLAEFEREPIPVYSGGKVARHGEQCKIWAKADFDAAPAARGVEEH
jgi:Resolvase, N terminal domain